MSELEDLGTTLNPAYRGEYQYWCAVGRHAWFMTYAPGIDPVAMDGATLTCPNHSEEVGNERRRGDLARGLGDVAVLHRAVVPAGGAPMTEGCRDLLREASDLLREASDLLLDAATAKGSEWALHQVELAEESLGKAKLELRGLLGVSLEREILRD